MVTRRLRCILLVPLAVAGCGLPSPYPADPVDPAAIAAFDFIRDPRDLLTDEDERRAEEALRHIARRTGVFGVVITVGRGDDPPRLFTSVVAEVEGIGGEALMTSCALDACGLDASTAHSEGLSEAVRVTGRVPEPAPRQGLQVALGVELRRWIEWVRAVATFERN